MQAADFFADEECVAASSLLLANRMFRSGRPILKEEIATMEKLHKIGKSKSKVRPSTRSS